jgi:hypothetical protein
MMAKAQSGALVLYCGHKGCFIADIYSVGDVNVVRASAAVTMDRLDRANYEHSTHHIVDFPAAGFWRPDLGVFVVPQTQVTELK